MKAIDCKVNGMKEHKKYALIDCKYFTECYANNCESYLCPPIKQECSTWKFESLLREEAIK